ncbi:hypothetical protein DFH07DRAFT_953118 [Mycena maculata]|uniref:DNA endonuclease activator Ctp1 C-terminal domain-containing protein n=1 Tax=Mycena maculata TaxID=230809 RepID=A0AAD7NS68_9AGAR|nr:hypothetical protein DFH07DRAFT_953118 [Mycena maculata]
MEVGATPLRTDLKASEDDFKRKTNTHIENLSRKICDLEAQSLKLSKALGFPAVSLADAFINLEEPMMPYKELVERIEGLQTDNERQRTEIHELRIERDTLRAKIDASESSPVLSAHNTPSKSDGATLRQLRDLQRRYDELQAVKQRADDKYKAGYRKFEAFKVHLRSARMQEIEDCFKADSPMLTTDERKTRRAEINSIKEKKIEELEAAEQEEIDGDDTSALSVPSRMVIEGDAEDHPTAITANSSEKDKENQQTPVPDVPRRRISVWSISAHSPITPVSQPGTKLQSTPLPTTTATSSTLTLVASARRVPQPVTQEGPSKQQSSTIILIPSSSDTEQNPFHGSSPFPSSCPPTPLPACPAVLNAANSSDTEDSQDPCLSFKVPGPVLQPQPTQDRKPLVMTSTPDLKPRVGVHPSTLPRASLQFVDQRSKSRTSHSDGGANSSMRRTDATDERPRKMRRVSSPGPGAAVSRRNILGEPGASVATPLYVGSGSTPRRKRDRDLSVSTGRRARPAAQDKGKGRQNELKMEATPVNARASSSKQLTDYSTYKGRGRYARDGAEGNTTINAKFVIDPAQNGGRDFQYDEVVRGQQDRRYLEAGDCECCRDYYEAIGPMPNRLQPPLWRTPPSSPNGGRPCLRNGTGTGSARKESAEITSHKQAISRHRHQWARAKTPPAYWSIGFPSTQEAADINEQAREMHRQKEMHVQEEARRDGGRYKKR